MSNIEGATNRSNFFPGSREASSSSNTQKLKATALKRNDAARKTALQSLTSSDAKVNISDAIRDFSRIKKAVDAAPNKDNSAKIAALKAQINGGTYKMDFEAMADKILAQEH
ncbi:MAG: flagellar biosynthesis anti-sigma factor FlgM [Halobacteriovoraceae bacterium]|jgi:negative regulator of flagellin synthesis FlgM|nr:flagellar biosynthesis anti-sigma factor FlgM [Halobacteriovoraceae bacterium]MBT5095699.1 flagellar biosynthesis anti-sigma factor FlgM [Halobacteriovoraceae bacterium]